MKNIINNNNSNYIQQVKNQNSNITSNNISANNNINNNTTTHKAAKANPNKFANDPFYSHNTNNTINQRQLKNEIRGTSKDKPSTSKTKKVTKHQNNKSIINWSESEVIDFLKRNNISSLLINQIASNSSSSTKGVKFNGKIIIELTNNDLRDEYKLNFQERQALLDLIKKELNETSKDISI